MYILCRYKVEIEYANLNIIIGLRIVFTVHCTVYNVQCTLCTLYCEK